MEVGEVDWLVGVWPSDIYLYSCLGADKRGEARG